MKATHRNKNFHQNTYAVVGTADRNGNAPAYYINSSGRFDAMIVSMSHLEPIPEPKTAAFDYESWLAFVFKHGCKVMVRMRGTDQTSFCAAFNDLTIAGHGWEEARDKLEYTTDGKTWHRLERVVES